MRKLDVCLVSLIMGGDPPKGHPPFNLVGAQFLSLLGTHIRGKREMGEI